MKRFLLKSVFRFWTKEQNSVTFGSDVEYISYICLHVLACFHSLASGQKKHISVFSSTEVTI